ncbi:hypothetical protein PR048_008187 [Dryococelus australis]|uniref:Uncharacterized protein n=1 Tax=Dryococelus australis TaxID=614101 RepID=A0ABQ9HWH4_9NEOP|nr:hypothetical protein PR048_008187 [Dryococelus australis]
MRRGLSATLAAWGHQLILNFALREFSQIKRQEHRLVPYVLATRQNHCTTKAIRVRLPAGSLTDFRSWGSYRTISLVGGFSRGYSVSPCPYIPTMLRFDLVSPSSVPKTPNLSTPIPENTTRIFRVLRVEAIAYLTHVAVSSLSLPDFSASPGEDRLKVLQFVESFAIFFLPRSQTLSGEFPPPHGTTNQLDNFSAMSFSTALTQPIIDRTVLRQEPVLSPTTTLELIGLHSMRPGLSRSADHRLVWDDYGLRGGERGVLNEAGRKTVNGKEGNGKRGKRPTAARQRLAGPLLTATTVFLQYPPARPRARLRPNFSDCRLLLPLSLPTASSSSLPPSLRCLSRSTLPLVTADSKLSGLKSLADFYPARRNIRAACVWVRARDVEIVLEDGASHRVFSGIFRFPRPCIPVLFHSHFISPSSALKTSRPHIWSYSVRVSHGCKKIERATHQLPHILCAQSTELVYGSGDTIISRGHSGAVGRILDSHPGEPGSIPGRVASRFPCVIIAPYDAAGLPREIL